MHIDEARELRAALGEALDPLYAARAGTIPALQGVQAAIVRLHAIDKALLAVLDRAARHDEALAAAYVAERARAVDAHIARGE